MKTSLSLRVLSAITLTAALIAGCQGEMISRNPKSRAAGMRDFNDGNYADAAGSFRDALRSDPRDYKRQFYLAQCYENLKQYQQAIQAYKASLDSQPLTLAGAADQEQLMRTNEALASCISKSDNRDAEINAIESSAKAKNSGRDWMLLGMIYRSRGDADSALDAFNRAYLINPKDFIVTKQYGLYLEQVGQKSKATWTLKKAYALNQTDEQVNDALRRLNVVPGPALKDEAALIKPPLPEGPLPQINWDKTVSQSSQQQSQDQAQPSAGQQPPIAPPPTATVVPPGERAVSGPRD
jgi:Tfp pilus assembly protein PilF